MPPNIATPMIRLAAMQTAAERIRKRRSGIRAASPIAPLGEHEADDADRRR